MNPCFANLPFLSVSHLEVSVLSLFCTISVKHLDTTIRVCQKCALCSNYYYYYYLGMHCTEGTTRKMAMFR